jgi:hypothetical protein
MVGWIAQWNPRRAVRAEMEKLFVLWCVATHRSLTWPCNGGYRCRACGRLYPVPWAEEGSRRSAPTVRRRNPSAAGRANANAESPGGLTGAAQSSRH